MKNLNWKIDEPPITNKRVAEKLIGDTLTYPSSKIADRRLQDRREQ